MRRLSGEGHLHGADERERCDAGVAEEGGGWALMYALG